MSLSTRSIALQGIGFSPAAMATLGFYAPAAYVAPVTPSPQFWPFVYPDTHYKRSRRTRHQRDADLLLMRPL